MLENEIANRNGGESWKAILAELEGEAVPELSVENQQLTVDPKTGLTAGVSRDVNAAFDVVRETALRVAQAGNARGLTNGLNSDNLFGFQQEELSESLPMLGQEQVVYMRPSQQSGGEGSKAE